MTLIEKIKNMEKKNLTRGEFKVAGVTFENRQEILLKIFQKYKVGQKLPIIVEHDKDNIYDKNALYISVSFQGELLGIGYVPKTINTEMLDLLPHLSFRMVGMGSNQNNGALGVTVEYVCKIPEEI